jgi:hypothetical protein
MTAAPNYEANLLHTVLKAINVMNKEVLYGDTLRA